jgi:hypothetical protein
MKTSSRGANCLGSKSAKRNTRGSEYISLLKNLEISVAGSRVTILYFRSDDLPKSNKFTTESGRMIHVICHSTHPLYDDSEAFD